MLNCRETIELCSAELDRPLRLAETLSLRAHLMMCSGCTNYRDQIKQMHRLMGAYAEGRADPQDGDAETTD